MTRFRRGSSRRSTTQRFSVFDFNEEDQSSEKSSKTFLKKLEENNRRSRKRDCPSSSSPANKDKFLECFTGGPGGATENDRARCTDVNTAVIDVDSGNEDDKESKSFHKVTTKGRTAFDPAGGMALGYDFPELFSLPNSKDKLFSEDLAESGSLSPVVSNFSNHEKQQVEMVSRNVMDKFNITCGSDLTSCVKNEDLKSMLDDGSVLNEIDYLTSTVVVFPDFIRYEDKYCTESRLIFTKSHIRIEGSAVNGVNGTFNAKWAVPDIIDIKAKWSAKVESALVVIHLKSKGSEVEAAFGTSRTDRLEFSVYDPCWYEVQEAIKSLDVKYHATWNVIFNQDKRLIDYCSQGKTFRDFTYPEGDTDPVIIGSRELELLLPGEFVNDTIVDFYIKYLQSKIRVEDQQRFHFFNSFFFRKLFDLDKKPLRAKEGKTAFQHVHNWTKSVNLFEKEFLFIPVNYSHHWSLIIICHPGKVARLREDEGEIFPNVPCIIHMDSIRGCHSDLNNLFQRYLYEEWKYRHNQTVKETCLRFLNLQFITPEVPRQKNYFDCGLFLLHYAELFLEAVLNVRLDERNLSAFSNINSSNFLNSNWFFPAEASLKRVHIRKLIHDVAEHYQNSSSNSAEDVMEEIGNDLLCCSAETSQERVLSSLSCETSTNSSQRSSEIGVVDRDPHIDDSADYLREKDKQGSPAVSSNAIKCVVEDSQETCEQSADSGFNPEMPIGPFLKSSDIEVVGVDDDDDQDYQKQVDKPDFPVVSRNVLECVVEDSQESWQQRVHPSTSSTFPPKSSEIEVVDVDDDHDHPKREADKQDFPTTSNNSMDCVVKDSQEEECTLNTFTLCDSVYAEIFEHHGAERDSGVCESLGNRGAAGHGLRHLQPSFEK